MSIRAGQRSGESERGRVEGSITARIHLPREQVAEFVGLANSLDEHQQNI